MPNLGQMSYYKTQVNSDTVYTALPWAGNVPYGYTPLSRADFLAGLSQKVDYFKKLQSDLVAANQKFHPGINADTLQNFASQLYSPSWYAAYLDSLNPSLPTEVRNRAAGMYPYYTGNIPSNGYINDLQTLLSNVQNGQGIYDPAWKDPSLDKFQPTAPTPSEQYYTTTFFKTLTTAEQKRLKDLFPGSYGSIVIATPAPTPPPVVTPTPTPKPTPIPAQTSLGVPGLISDLVDLKLKANAALNDFINAQRANTEVNVRLSTVFADEAGNHQYGQTKQVVTGSFSNGQPKYKTITTKFAILDIYDKKNGKRGSKIGTTLIGTVDSLALKPSTAQLDEIEKGIV